MHGYVFDCVFVHLAYIMLPIVVVNLSTAINVHVAVIIVAINAGCPVIYILHTLHMILIIMYNVCNA